MPSSSRNNNSNSFENWFSKPLNRIMTFCGAASALLGIGYQVGKYVEADARKYEIIELKQKHYEELQEEKNKCREIKIEKYEETVEDLKNFVKEYKKKEAANEK